MTLAWQEAMSIDGSVIDNDHKCLIGLINVVEAMRPGPAMYAGVETAIAQLLAYAQVHFEREEKLQTRSAFTYAQAHRSRHRNIMRDMEAMLKECKQSPLAALPQFHARLCDYLHHWLRDHIFKADMLMKPFVADMRQHTEKFASLPDAVRMKIHYERPTGEEASRQLPLSSREGHRRRT
jgi:hemerythrin